MNKHIALFVALSTFAVSVSAQNFPVKEWKSANNNKALIFYISGDGGLNKFSEGLCTSLNNKGFDVNALDSKSYFWDKKTPEQTAADISNFLNSKMAGRQNQQIVLIGYSFGADVLPFVLSKLTKTIHDKVMVSFLMVSSGSTDFEIHWSDMFGSGKKRSMDVLTAVNQLDGDKVVILSGDDDHELDPKKITLKNHSSETLPGGHHFDGDIEGVTKTILKYI